MEEESEEESGYCCKICNDDDFGFDYDVPKCCKNIICTSCLSNITKNRCPICNKPLEYYFITSNNLPIFNKSLIDGNNRKLHTEINIILTDDFEDSIKNKKEKYNYKHWYEWHSLILKKYDLSDICEKIAGYWEKSYYSTNEIEDIKSKLKKDDTEYFQHVIEPENEYNLMPNKIFIYNNDFAFMFERTYGSNESDDIIHNEIIYPICAYE
tara:strand:- start:1202 stop:1834 length:633 start_codon:yes stop_codon:yes gene_type:complete